MTNLVRGSPRLALYAAAYGFAAIVHKGLGFCLFFWLAHTLPQSDYARFGLLYALQTGLIAVATAGVVEMVIGRHHGLPIGEQRNLLYRTGNGVFLWLSLLAGFGAMGTYVSLLARYASVWDLLVISATAFLLAFFTLQASFVRLDEAHRQSLVLGFLPPVVGLGCAFLSFSVWGTLTAFFGGMDVALLIMFFALYRWGMLHLGVTIRISNLVSVKSELAPYIVIALLAWLSGYGGTYLVESMFELTDVAVFTFIYTLSSILPITATALNQVWAPRFFRKATVFQPVELERENLVFYGVQGVILGLVGATVLIILPLGLEVIGGNLASYRDSGKGLAWLYGGYAVAIPWWHAQNYFYMHKQGLPLMRTLVITTILGLTMWVMLMFSLGVPGIYVGFFMMMLIRSLAVWRDAHARWNILLTWHGPVAACILLFVGVGLSNLLWSTS